jgi:hypothetical protein
VPEAAKSGVRVNSLAKEMGIESKDILAKLKGEGLDWAHNHTSTLTFGQAETVREWNRSGELGGAKPATPAGLLGFETLGEFKMSWELTDLIVSAKDEARSLGAGEVSLSGSLLLFATETTIQKSPSPYVRFLEEELRRSPNFEAVRTSYLDQLGTERRASWPGDRWITPKLTQLFTAAAELTKRTTRGTIIGTRHLVGSLLVEESSTSDLYHWIRECGLEIEHLRLRLLDIVRANDPDDRIEAWAHYLADSTASERAATNEASSGPAKPSISQGAVSPASLPSRRTLPGFNADDTDGQDLLAITPDVDAFAALVASKSLKPPLSVGLFGHWGSGKSFFMRKLKKRVGELAAAARLNSDATPKPEYHAHVFQVDFNAWHYADANLWASLVDHLFQNLRLTDNDPERELRLRRDQLVQHLDACVAKRIEVEGAVKRLQAQRKNATQELRDLDNKLRANASQLNVLMATDVWEQLTLSEDAKAEVREAMAALGFPAAESMTEIRNTLREVATLAGKIRALWIVMVRGGGLTRTLLYLSVLIVASVGASVVAAKAAEIATHSDFAKGACALVTQLVTAVGMVGVWVRARYATLSSALGQMKRAIDKPLADAERVRDDQIAQLKGSLQAINDRYDGATEELKTAEAAVVDAQNELADLSAGRMLARFIEDRTTTDDYRQHLGLLALIRRDFEKLSSLMHRKDDPSAATAKIESERNPLRIDRIVLYIDDLDRCPPQRVVEVLQAVHLLLAFPLFVVIVGVDARWVSKSLTERYSMLNGSAAPDDGEPAQAATPNDYLEKIFQVPFWLRPLHGATYGSLIRGLIDPAAILPSPHGPADAVVTHTKRPTRPQDSAAGTTGPAVPDVLPAHETRSPPPDPPATSPQAPELSREIDLNPPGLMLFEHEVEFMGRLDSLLCRSPRAAKRFLNTYRLIRAHLGQREMDSFTELQNGEYKLVMLLLAILVGLPDSARELLRTIAETEESLDLTREPSVKRVPGWDAVAALLRAELGQDRLGATALEPFKRWIPTVSQYSFQGLGVGA